MVWYHLIESLYALQLCSSFRLGFLIWSRRMSNGCFLETTTLVEMIACAYVNTRRVPSLFSSPFAFPLSILAVARILRLRNAAPCVLYTSPKSTMFTSWPQSQRLVACCELLPLDSLSHASSECFPGLALISHRCQRLLAPSNI
jgi:hypothetical protein